ncbi:hypothetical protein ASPZODRAFT_1137767 [Penicilliopsis zonata CBS 506.65]|uniref:Zn(2)-C6 fungal-type domain-containing protein n=1 Tax=Penicilliopsis zonata CBS 506.65 TaxID=1073090 RepID=A0A1L9ST01_9EURO|nr:hypothetical protein ASPZODRAFT_1137767 [Penicilliopsis zonata CBS 506.65]OJJ50266.1 hypothetical protein ASPZODRAFT_1137767 [Penicilliopsis zonata CBS 506.65]
MGRSTWNTKSCRTCVKRKVKCDKARPRCLRCRRSGTVCEGFSGLILLTDSTLLSRQRSLVAHQQRAQLLSRFLEDYLPPQASNEVAYTTPVSWVERFPDFSRGNSPLIRNCVSALALMHFAKTRQIDSLVREDAHYYSPAVQETCTLQRNQCPADLTRAAMILGLYELYSLGPSVQLHAWRVHIIAATQLAQELSPPIQSLSNSDLRRLQTLQFLQSCATRKEQRCPQRANHGSNNRFDQLMDVLFEVGELYRHLEQIRVSSGETKCRSTDLLLRKAFDIEQKLLGWCHELQSENCSTPLFLAKCDEQRSNQTIITFPNASAIPLLMLYWLGMVVIYSSASEGLQMLEVDESIRMQDFGVYEFGLNLSARSEQFDYDQTLEDEAEVLCKHFVSKISQSQADCMEKGLGTATLAAASLQAAQHLCSHMWHDPPISPSTPVLDFTAARGWN